MTVTVEAVPMAIFLVACFVAYLVFRHSSRDAHGAPTRGDLGAAVATAGIVVTVLAWLLGAGGGSGDEISRPQDGVPTVSQPPTPQSSEPPAQQPR